MNNNRTFQTVTVYGRWSTRLLAVASAVTVLALALSAACDGSTGTSNATGTCQSTCTKSIALGCPEGEHDQASCVSSCQGQQASCVAANQASTFQTYLDCIESNPMTCGTASHTPTSEACVKEGLATFACVVSAQ